MKNRRAIFSKAFIVLALFVSGCDSAERDTATDQATTASPKVSPMITPEKKPSPETSPGTGQWPEWLANGATHSVAGITSAPRALIGKTVTVVANVEEVYGSRAFKLDGGESRRGDDKDLLALIPKVGGFPVIDEQWVNNRARVTGVIQWMAPAYVEREIGWELPRSLEAKFKGGLVLIVRHLELLER